MPTHFLILTIVVCVFAVSIPLIFFFAAWLPNYRSIMKRARKIDPTVKTLADAQYVLQKNVMQSINKKDDSEENDNEAEDKKEQN